MALPSKIHEARSSVAPAGTMQWKLIRDLSESEIEKWRELAAHAIEPNVFLDPDFARAAINLPDQNVGVVLITRDGKLTGFFPGRFEALGAGNAAKTFVTWTHPFAPLCTPLIARKRASQTLAAFLHYISNFPGAPSLAIFPFLNEEGEVAVLLRELLAQKSRKPYRYRRHLRAALIPKTENSLQPSSKKLKELRRQLRRLEEAGTVSHDAVSDPENIGAALDDYIALEQRGWKGREGTAASSKTATENFLRSAVLALAGEGKAKIDVLRLNGEAIAACITLFSGGRAWFWKIAYDEAHARFSPGVQLTLKVSERLAENGRLTLVDSCAVADHPMIDHIWSGRLQMAHWLVPLRGKTSFIAGIVAEEARARIAGLLSALRNRFR